MTPRRDDWHELVIAGVIATLYALLLLGTLEDLGYARDEGFYFHAARSYQQWFALAYEDPSAAWSRVDEFWRVNNEHPALIKSLFALSHSVLWEQYGLFDMEGTSFRFPAIVLSGMGVGLVYLWGARAAGRVAGMVAALSLAALPRFFFHAHLACFDAPMVTLWTLCAYCYWRALERGGALRMLLVGVTFALALDTKHNAWFLPIVCGLHAAIASMGRTEPEHRRRSLIALVSMGTVGPLLFYAMWPWIWHDTLARLSSYVSFHLEHVYYNMEYLGVNYHEPPMPRSYAFVMTAATVPFITLLLFVLGLFKRAPLTSRTALLWMLALGVQYAAWLRPTTPIFGGTKHWMTAYPFIALFAGVGAAGALRSLERRYARAWLVARSGAAPRKIWLRAAFVVSLVLPGVIASGRAHPWGLSAYSPLVGGAPGAASLGLNRGFWGYTTGAVAEYLNDTAPRDARVFLHDTTGHAWQMMLADGRLRSDLIGVNQVGDADIALYHHELHMQGVEVQSWVALGTTAPAHIAGIDGVPVIWIYVRPPKPTSGD